ncbi:MAG: GNAT family N-acetyltransferase [Roseovarius sp.]|jgi:hypothetical protein|uniref:lipid II:glycine glycyltransferase FemX n=1 Tax=Roseovarius sp. TaxID=1486281 RepID=UPI0032EC6B89
MEIEVQDALSDRLTAEWDGFLSNAVHQHVRQDPRFGPVDLAEGNEVRYALGRENGGVKAVGLFTLRPHPFLPGAFTNAISLSGPVSDDPAVFVSFMEGVRRHKAFAKVGRISVTPYWLDEQAEELGAHLAGRGWIMSEPRYLRLTGIVDITGTASDIASQFSQTCRRKLRKAEKEDLEVVALQEDADAADFLARLNCHRTERGLGALRQDAFMTTFEHVYRGGDLGVIRVIYHRGRFVAGIVLHRSRDTTHFIYSVHDDEVLAELNNLRISPFLMLDAMKWASEKGCRYFDLEGYGNPDDPDNPLKHIHKYKSEFKPTPTLRVPQHHKISNRMIYLSGNFKDILKNWIKAKILKRQKYFDSKWHHKDPR